MSSLSKSSQQPGEVDDMIIVLILKLRKLKYREAEELTLDGYLVVVVRCSPRQLSSRLHLGAHQNVLPVM